MRCRSRSILVLFSTDVKVRVAFGESWHAPGPLRPCRTVAPLMVLLPPLGIDGATTILNVVTLRSFSFPCRYLFITSGPPAISKADAEATVLLGRGLCLIIHYYRLSHIFPDDLMNRSDFLFPAYLFCSLIAGCWAWEHRPYKDTHYWANVSNDKNRKQSR